LAPLVLLGLLPLLGLVGAGLGTRSLLLGRHG
jgi:hypothetical protein